MKKSVAPRVLRVARRRGHPGAVRADLGVSGVQDPDRVDGARTCSIGDHLIVNKMVFAPAATGVERALLPVATDPARRRHRLQVSRGAGARLHQARHRPAGRPLELRREEDLHQRPADRRAVRPLPRAAVAAARRHPDDLREQYGPVTVPRRPVLHDGRQPRQLGGQPLLGLHAAGLRQGQGAVHLLLARRKRLAAAAVLRYSVGPSAE